MDEMNIMFFYKGEKLKVDLSKGLNVGGYFGRMNPGSPYGSQFWKTLGSPVFDIEF